MLRAKVSVFALSLLLLGGVNDELIAQSERAERNEVPSGGIELTCESFQSSLKTISKQVMRFSCFDPKNISDISKQIAGSFSSSDSNGAGAEKSMVEQFGKVTPQTSPIIEELINSGEINAGGVQISLSIPDATKERLSKASRSSEAENAIVAGVESVLKDQPSISTFRSIALADRRFSETIQGENVVVVAPTNAAIRKWSQSRGATNSRETASAFQREVLQYHLATGDLSNLSTGLVMAGETIQTANGAIIIVDTVLESSPTAE